MQPKFKSKLTLIVALTALLTLAIGGSNVFGKDFLPYDTSADAKADLQRALAAAKTNKKPVLILFGANWCEDCRSLDRAINSDKNAPLLSGAFNLVKIDVGNFDHNLDIAAAYGNPIKRGIPAAVVVSVDNRVLYSTKAGELADARRMSETGIYDFFNRVIASTSSRK